MKLYIAAALTLQTISVAAQTNAICQGFDGATPGDAQWAALNRKADLHLGPKGLWNGRIVTCRDYGGRARTVFAFCRSDSYREYTTKLERGFVACGSPGWKGCFVC
ncbi:uncharacterized protein CTRU02_210371 [Colletotrichum truncatum]|uniref:Uncharacterized protein n=1 Tax=Colletotrichum truncatum TaxID=5467 RepID=A0ACC3YV19_COLTU|nr:uncharacterized protein CTRU02_15290 [Colletotrichum truncatum]KAF6781195.1 hypothetical protein CTRU02_15290 [Colletotrichum truncatum]